MLVLEGWAEIVAEDANSETSHDCLEEEIATWHSTVKVRIIRQPAGRIDGISLKHYRPGQSYDVPSALANYLVIEGFALVEMRQKPRFATDAHHRPRAITLHRATRTR